MSSSVYPGSTVLVGREVYPLMSSMCCVSGSDTARDCPCVLENARDACGEALAELYAEDPLSRPGYWVGRLGFLMEYLLAATEPPGD